MIVRVYRARTHAGMDKDFEQFLVQTALPLMRKSEGCRDVILGRTKWGGQPEFVIVSKWDSVDALKRFAGPDWQSSRILPEEAHLVKQVFTDHYEVL
jgi:heme-degrading monooxygenase HmoA